MTQGIITASQYAMDTARDYYSLCKPRVTALIVFAALCGMLIATPRPQSILLLLSTITGIALVAGSAAALNALIECHIDAKMDRTRQRPLPSGRINLAQAGVFSAVIAISGLALLYSAANALTMWLTLASFIGYSIIYTLLLKPHTSQNIVIGGAAGAMPPVLGWSAATNSIGLEPILLFLIIFLWTPPHFWSLALYYRKDYEKSGFPMLPVTRGTAFTQLNILVYTGALVLVSLLPYIYGMAAKLYLLAALALGALFLRYAIQLYRHFSNVRALQTFKFSIVYLFLLFAALITDHFLSI
jgi:protoheme IX farnesyltransferase